MQFSPVACHFLPQAQISASAPYSRTPCNTGGKQKTSTQIGDKQPLSDWHQYTETEDNRTELHESPPVVGVKCRLTWINHMGSRVTCKV